MHNAGTQRTRMYMLSRGSRHLNLGFDGSTKGGIKRIPFILRISQDSSNASLGRIERIERRRLTAPTRRPYPTGQAIRQRPRQRIAAPARGCLAKELPM